MSRWMAGQFDAPAPPEGDAKTTTTTAGNDTAGDPAFASRSAQGAPVHV
jgi:hypothetical protein